MRTPSVLLAAIAATTSVLVFTRLQAQYTDWEWNWADYTEPAAEEGMYDERYDYSADTGGYGEEGGDTGGWFGGAGGSDSTSSSNPCLREPDIINGCGGWTRTNDGMCQAPPGTTVNVNPNPPNENTDAYGNCQCQADGSCSPPPPSSAPCSCSKVFIPPGGQGYAPGAFNCVGNSSPTEACRVNDAGNDCGCFPISSSTSSSSSRSSSSSSSSSQLCGWYGGFLGIGQTCGGACPAGQTCGAPNGSCGCFTSSSSFSSSSTTACGWTGIYGFRTCNGGACPTGTICEPNLCSCVYIWPTGSSRPSSSPPSSPPRTSSSARPSCGGTFPSCDGACPDGQSCSYNSFTGSCGCS